ncbi:DM13 domain-containing protein [Kribbella sp. NPDC026611]|uniref:DM13 domain-containing protein n=1 Tax=Kribbella sp. NPDC026611 TaxID=3154911 RepID=UPI003405A7E2
MRKRAAAIATAVVVAAVALPLFQPWKLVTDEVVDEALPGTAPIPTTASSTTPPTISVERPQSPLAVKTGPRVLLTGQLITHEHRTEGSVRILALPDGTRVLRLENLATSDGPDLKVWLSDAAVTSGRQGWHVFDDGAYRSLGSLKGNHGNQNYPIPADVRLDAFRSVTIWCDRFNVSFGAAELKPA